MNDRYAEIEVTKHIIEKYVEMQKYEYEHWIKQARTEANHLSNSIDSQIAENRVKNLSICSEVLERSVSNYKSGMELLGLFEKIEELYQSSKDKDENIKIANRLYYDIYNRTDFKRIMSERAYELYLCGDEHITDLGTNYAVKADKLFEEYTNGKITQEQMIFYDKMCLFLINNPYYRQHVGITPIEEDSEQMKF